jgi:hypothetical protein
MLASPAVGAFRAIPAVTSRQTRPPQSHTPSGAHNKSHCAFFHCNDALRTRCTTSRRHSRPATSDPTSTTASHQAPAASPRFPRVNKPPNKRAKTSTRPSTPPVPFATPLRNSLHPELRAGEITMFSWITGPRITNVIEDLQPGQLTLHCAAAPC